MLLALAYRVLLVALVCSSYCYARVENFWKDIQTTLNQHGASEVLEKLARQDSSSQASSSAVANNFESSTQGSNQGSSTQNWNEGIVDWSMTDESPRQDGAHHAPPFFHSNSPVQAQQQPLHYGPYAQHSSSAIPYHFDSTTQGWNQQVFDSPLAPAAGNVYGQVPGQLSSSTGTSQYGLEWHSHELDPGLADADSMPFQDQVASQAPMKGSAHEEASASVRKKKSTFYNPKLPKEYPPAPDGISEPPTFNEDDRVKILDQVRKSAEFKGFGSSKLPAIHPYRGLQLTPGLVKESFGNAQVAFRQFKDDIFIIRGFRTEKELYYTPEDGKMHPEIADKRYLAYVWQRTPAQPGSVFRLIRVVESNVLTSWATQYMRSYISGRKPITRLGSDAIHDASDWVPEERKLAH